MTQGAGNRPAAVHGFVQRFGARSARVQDMSNASPSPFSYEIAFNRNIGWLTDFEQQALRGKRVAIAGMGGVGGFHLTTLTRLGVGAFHIADFDRFELGNFNRQIGATMDNIDRPKVEVLAEMARQINPELDVVAFDAGVSAENLDAFLRGVDLFIDGLDFFVLDLRRQVFARCAALGIPAITAAPLGMGTAFLVFHPDGMSFEDYFRLEGLPPEKQYVNFLLGLAPRGLHRPYLVDPSRVDLSGKRGPSTVAACQLCAGVTSAEALKLLLGRGKVRAAPCYQQFDAYRGKWIAGRLVLGNRNPLQRLKLAVAYRAFAAWSRRAAAPEPTAAPLSELERILDAARWAPSGDNTQPWRFEVTGEDSLIVHVHDQAKDDLYDYRDGEPTLLSAGMLLESLRIAATVQGRRAQWTYEGRDGNHHRIEVRLPRVEGVAADPLYASLFLRSVDRRRYRLGRLTAAQKERLVEALGDALAVEWHEGLRERWQFARLSARATHIRLSIPEAFRIHQRVIDWEHAYSEAGIPAGAVGLDAATRRLMRWAMKDWTRLDRLNRWLGGTTTAALQMDYVPGLASGAYFSVRVRNSRPSDPADRAGTLLRAGMGLQRFWLVATRLDLAMQPSLATLIFAFYGREAAPFAASESARLKARRLGEAVNRYLDRSDDLVFVGRIGRGRRLQPAYRSVRRPLRDLMHTAHPDTPNSLRTKDGS